jgi:tRNA dimethylallyltransferase
MITLDNVDADKHVLIAGPTASGKSGLALRIAQTQGGIIVNADALQVFDNWRVLTARPDAVDEGVAVHKLYGHVGKHTPYSVGHWLRDVAELLKGHDRLIIVGGTGLYFRALSEGLSDIPPIPTAIREQADLMRRNGQLDQMIADLTQDTTKTIDLQNPMRVQRAWEVQKTTGQSLAAWHAATPAPLLGLEKVTPLVINAPKDWLSPRIAQRFDLMIDQGALEEVAQNAPDWDADLPSSKAIGAPELMAYVQGSMDLQSAKDAAIIATRQYAKRQRTWFKARMRDWISVEGRML